MKAFTGLKNLVVDRAKYEAIRSYDYVKQTIQNHLIHELLLNPLLFCRSVEDSLDTQLSVATAGKSRRGSTTQNDQTILLLDFATTPQKRGKARDVGDAHALTEV